MSPSFTETCIHIFIAILWVQLSGTIIAGISLHSDCVMTYEKERGRPERFRVRLPRRCLQVGAVLKAPLQSYEEEIKEEMDMDMNMNVVIDGKTRKEVSICFLIFK
jgi:hypothetical protein